MVSYLSGALCYPVTFALWLLVGQTGGIGEVWGQPSSHFLKAALYWWQPQDITHLQKYGTTYSNAGGVSIQFAPLFPEVHPDATPCNRISAGQNKGSPRPLY